MNKKNLLLVILISFFSLIIEPKAPQSRSPQRKSMPRTHRRPLRKTHRRAHQKQPTRKPSRQTALPPKKINLHLALHKAVQPADQKTAIGIKIMALDQDKCLFQKNADQLFIPASNTKLITAGAAFHILGKNYIFRTQLLTDYLSSSRIHNLYIKGAGDPTLTTKDLEKLVLSLKTRGIKEIRGNLIIDCSVFDMQPSGPGWSKGDGPIFYKAPISGLMVNHSCMAVRVKPARIVGRAPIVMVDRENRAIRIINKARTTQQAKKYALHVSRTQNNTITITGTIALRSKHKYYRVALAQPHLYAGHILHTLLKRHTIALRGQILVGLTPKAATVIARHRSKPLSTIIHHMMKHSDNLYADALFKTMGAVTSSTQGSWANGKKAVERFLRNEVQLSDPRLMLNDGSGLSRTNKISPHHLSRFLGWIYKRSHFKEAFIESLPISGVDGTLRHRMKHNATHAKVKAKTGTLFDVSSLSGYITPKQSPPLLFVIMVNRKNKSAAAFKRTLEDHVCRLLATHAFSTS